MSCAELRNEISKLSHEQVRHCHCGKKSTVDAHSEVMWCRTTDVSLDEVSLVAVISIYSLAALDYANKHVHHQHQEYNSIGHHTLLLSIHAIARSQLLPDSLPTQLPVMDSSNSKRCLASNFSLLLHNYFSWFFSQYINSLSLFILVPFYFVGIDRTTEYFRLIISWFL